MEKFELSYAAVKQAYEYTNNPPAHATRSNLKSEESAISGVAFVLAGLVLFKISDMMSAWDVLLQIEDKIMTPYKHQQGNEYSNYYKKILNLMTSENFTRVRFEGSFTDCGDGIYSINGFPKVIGYRTKSGIWQTAS
ncbi:MAG: hypothetical protein KH073_20500 [Clostridium sp.]|uniref:hypothetical protein n=1 Tax=Clostridium sp. TaxID=1506 RepID=UPI0025801B48|nr:hypothetical protein [Clostridium sp.]MBS4843202.1 hypothetical protein [Clostridium sp.]